MTAGEYHIFSLHGRDTVIRLSLPFIVFPILKNSKSNVILEPALTHHIYLRKALTHLAIISALCITSFTVFIAENDTLTELLAFSGVTPIAKSTWLGSDS